MQPGAHVKLLASLFKIADGACITAIDTNGSLVYCGLQTGTIHKLRVSRDNSDNSISTVVMLTAAFGVKKQKKIKRLVHSNTDPLLFVLTRKRLLVLSSDDFTLLREVARDVGTFTLSTSQSTLSSLSPSTAMSCSTAVMEMPGSARSLLGSPNAKTTTRAAFSTSSPPGSPGRHSGKQGPPLIASSTSPVFGENESRPNRTVHRICCCLREERRVVVYEFVWEPPSAKAPPSRSSSTVVSRVGAGSGRVPTVVLDFDAADGGAALLASARHGLLTRHPKEFLFPEPIVVALEHNAILCVGMPREYSIVSLIDGDAKSLLALNGEEPAMVLHEGSLYLRLNNVLFVAPVNGLSQMTKESMRLPRTVLFEHRPTCFTVRHGVALSFSTNCCEVYSMYDEDVFQRLPLEGGQCVSENGDRDTIVCATEHQVWLVVLHDLRARVMDLVIRYKLGDAADLIMRTGEASLEPEYKVAAAFRHLRHGAMFEAMAYFNVLIDIRQVLRYVPGVRPLCAVDPPSRRAELLGPMKHVAAAPYSETDVDSFLSDAHPSIAAALAPPDMATEVDFWVRWTSCDVHDPHIDTLEDAWKETFETLELSPRATRLFNGKEITLQQFTERCLADLTVHLMDWLRSRLHEDARNVTTRPERRAGEFALLALLLSQGDALGVYTLLSHATAMELRDALPLLVTYRQFRALGLLLQRHALVDAAESVYRKYLSIHANFEATSLAGGPLHAGLALGAQCEAIAERSAVIERLQGCRSGTLGEAPYSMPLPLGLRVSSPNRTEPTPSSPCPSSSPLVDAVPPPPLAFTDELYFAVESADVSYIAQVLSRRGAALLQLADDRGATALHVACASAWLGPERPVVPFAKRMTTVAYIASRGANLNATLCGESGLRACVASLASRVAVSPADDRGGLSIAERCMIVGAACAGAAPLFCLSP